MIIFYLLFVILSWKHEAEWMSEAYTFHQPAVVGVPCPADAKKRRLYCPE
jgi:hypothetical protein